MQRQDITLGNYTYVVDLYKANTDIEFNHYERYVVLRNMKLMADVLSDNAIYFIEKDVLDEYANGDGTFDLARLSESIAYPVINERVVGYSTNYEVFNNNFTDGSMVYGNDIYKLYQNTNNEYVEDPNVLCDKIRIYYPSINPFLNSIICVSQFINGIDFFYLCRPSSVFKTKTNDEFTLNHVTYSEYIEFYVPNYEFLFKTDNLYFVEDANVNMVRNEFTDTLENGTTVTTTTNVKPYMTEDNVLKNKLNITLVVRNNPEITFDIDGTTYKTNTIKIGISNAQLQEAGMTLHEAKTWLIEHNNTKHLNFTVTSSRHTHIILIQYIYTGSKSLRLGVFSDDVSENIGNTFVYEMPLDIQKNSTCTIGNNVHTISNGYEVFMDNVDVVSLQTLLMPFSIENGTKVFDLRTNIIPATNDAPLKIELWPYERIENDGTYVLSEELNTNSDSFSISNEFRLVAHYAFFMGKLVVQTEWIYPRTESLDTPWVAYKYYNNVNKETYENVEIDDEYDIETSITKLGYRIEISNDKYFNEIIYKYDINIDPTESEDDNNLIDNFIFELDNIFDSWDNINEMLAIRTMFIDRSMSNVIYSNVLVLDKEHFKYLINDILHYRIHMDGDKFNFIDKINAVVVKEGNSSNESLIVSNNKPKILYKPIFYKVAELQTIRLRPMLTQNIGINLADIMTKVESFKLIIDNNEFVEKGRNDVYVIFEVRASAVSGASGIYYILNQDDEYISDGSWIIS